MIPWKRLIRGNNGKSQVTMGWGEEHRRFQGSETTQCNTEINRSEYGSLTVVKIHNAYNTRSES